MKKVKKRYILWDLDGTLWRHKKNEIRLMAKNTGIPYTRRLEEQFFYMIGRFNIEFSTKIVTQEGISELIERTMPELFFRNVSGKQFLDAWSHTQTNILNSDTTYVLKKIMEKGIQNIIVTDWILYTQVSQMKHFGIIQYIKKIYSCENSYTKRNPKLVSKIIKEGREDDYIIIGDSLTSDILFAKNANIESVWYNPNKIHNETSLQPTYEITSLLEVLDIVE